jgi:YfiH family protein
MTISLLRARALDSVAGVVHGFTTRDGGGSAEPWSSLNLGLGVGDDRAAVTANRDAVMVALGRPGGVWVSARQVHGHDVVEVTRSAGPSMEADGLWTRDRSVAVAVLVADCVPILMAHESGDAIAAVHAGWRGTRDRIAASMVERLGKAGYAAEGLRVAVGPAIGSCCFEVGEDVAAELGAIDETAITAVETKPHADLWALNRRVLVDAGIPEAHIDVFRVCTSCREDFFSHRRDQGQCGRQAGVIGFGPVS